MYYLVFKIKAVAHKFWAA